MLFRSMSGIGEYGSLWGLSTTGKHSAAWIHDSESPRGRLVLQDLTRVAGFVSREVFLKFKAEDFKYSTKKDLTLRNPQLMAFLISVLSRAPYRSDGSN